MNLDTTRDLQYKQDCDRNPYVLKRPEVDNDSHRLLSFFVEGNYWRNI